ncbi:Nn.00g064620.m01.CDS01 [Neocucurbitaria sp. VM-36]
MDSSRASSRSRRSYPNLHNLSLAPLSAKYPLDASTPPSPDEQVRTPRTSYIAQKSAPTTPGILSLSQSRSNSRHRPKKAYAYDTYFVDPEHMIRGEVRDVGDIPKAKSTSTLLHHRDVHVGFADDMQGGGVKKHHMRKGTAPLPLRMPLVRHHTSEANDEWFHRAGLAIAGETRDSKGQGWLVRRESSTSLVHESDGYEQHPSHDARHIALLSGEHLGDGDFATFFSPRMSRAGSRITSRVGSRVHSARQSRRGSRVGSRVDLKMSAGSKPQSGRQSFEELEERFIEPDFIEADEESDGDEEEVARLARERASGLGGWMDRLIGWTLFSVDEDGEGSDDDDEEEYGGAPRLENMTKDELKLRREVEAKRRKLEREAIIAASALKARDAEGGEDSSRPSTGDAQRPATNEEAGGWQDAAWLLSVASKALLS